MVWAGRAAIVGLSCALACTLVASCSGSSFPGARPPVRSSTTVAAARRTTTTRPDARTQYASAIADGLRTEGHQIPGLTAPQRACIAAAIVDGVGVERFRAAGVAPDEMRESGHQLPTRLANEIPEPARRDVGGRLQRCGVAYAMAKPLFVGLSKQLVNDFADASCMASGLNAAERQLVVADFVLVTTPSSAGASSLADVFLQCVRFGELTVHDLGAPLSSGEVDCVDRSSRTDSIMHEAAVDAFVGITAGSNLGYGLARIWVRCLTPAHLRILETNPGRPIDT